MSRRMGFNIQKPIQDEAKAACWTWTCAPTARPGPPTGWPMPYSPPPGSPRSTVRPYAGASRQGKGGKCPDIYDMSVDAIEAMERAIIEDRAELNHVEFRAEFIQTAVIATIERGMKRSDRDTLPPALERPPHPHQENLCTTTTPTTGF